MNIADKTLQLKKDFDDVYKKGQSSMVDESKIIEKTVSGEYISVDDVSEIPHEVKVKLTSETLTDYSGVSLTRCGNNLLPYPYHGLTYSNGITFKENSDRSITINGTNNGKDNSVFYITLNKEILLPQGTYTGSPKETGVTMMGQTKEGGYKHLNTTFTLDKDTTFKYIYIQIINGTTRVFDNITLYPMLNFGSTPLPYEPYNGQTLTANADGTVEGVESTSPYMYMTTDNPNCTINATYHKSYGMQTEYDRFWDTYLRNINDFNYLFSGQGWKYELLEKIPIALNISTCVGLFACNNDIKDLSKFPLINGVLKSYNCSELVRSARKLKKLFSIDGTLTTTFYNAFIGCNELESVSFVANTVKANLSFKDSPLLNKESILNIFAGLSSTVTGLTLTLSATAVTNAFGSTTATEWTNLVATKTNWTISLV